MPASPNEIADQIASVESLNERADKAAARIERRDRSAIAQKVVWLYIGAVLACFIFTIGIFWFFVPCPPAAGGGLPTSAAACLAWKEPADFLLQVLTTAVLPIVTLVLGYYFGTAKAEGL